jgi:hypothetical protein
MPKAQRLKTASARFQPLKQQVELGSEDYLGAAVSGAGLVRFTLFKGQMFATTGSGYAMGFNLRVFNKNFYNTCGASHA